MMMKAFVPLVALFALAFSQPPANDNVCNAVDLSYRELSSRCLHVEFDLRGASLEEGEVAPPEFNGNDNDQNGWWEPIGPSHSVWYYFLAETDTTLGLIASSPRISGDPNRTGDPRVAIWSSTARIDCDGFNEFTLVAANDDGCQPVIFEPYNPEKATYTATIDDCFSCAWPFNAYKWAFDVTIGLHYWIQLDGFLGKEFPGTLQVSTTRGPPPYFTEDDIKCIEYSDQARSCREELNALTVDSSSPHHEAYMMARDTLSLVDDLLEKETMGEELTENDLSNHTNLDIDFTEVHTESFAAEKRSTVRDWSNWCPKADTFLRCVKCTIVNKVKSAAAKAAVLESLKNLERKIALRCS